MIVKLSDFWNEIIKIFVYMYSHEAFISAAVRGSGICFV